MTIGIRRKKRSTFVQIENSLFENEDLSYKAKGLLGYLLSRPDNWVIREVDLINRSKDGRDSVRSGLKELENHNYLRKWQIRNKGIFGDLVWVYDDIPISEEELIEMMGDKKKYYKPVPKLTSNIPLLENPTTGSRRREIRKRETTPLNNTNINNTNLNNTNSNNISLKEREKIEQFAEELANQNGNNPLAYKTTLLKNWDELGLTTLEEIKQQIKPTKPKGRILSTPDWLNKNEHEHAHQKMHSETDLEKIKQMKELQSKILSFRNEQK